MNNDLKEACKTIAEFVGRRNFNRYLISRDGGESMVIEFSTDHEATKYLCEQQAKGWMMEYGVVKKEGVYFDYATSLDALVPVWEKITKFKPHGEIGLSEFFTKSWNQETYALIRFSDCQAVDTNGKTIQQAACLATAKAIRELKKDEKNGR